MARNLPSIQNEEIEKLYRQPISIQDAASMLRKNVSKNDRPYTQVVKKYNNQRVDNWYHDILIMQGGAEGKVPATSAWPSFQIYNEGLDITAMQKFTKYFVRATPEQIQFWIDFFEKSSVEQLCDAGVGTVAYGFQLIMSEVKLYFAEQKWNKIYSQDVDPRKWNALASANMSLISGENMPFGLTRESYSELSQKVSAVLTNQVEVKAYN